MPASKLELPVENPSALIRSRIREKRIFEARFLFRQLGAEIGEMEKSALERELSVSLAQVKKMQQQAREYAAQGQNDLAETLYSEIERIAIDVPGLAEEKKALAGAEALIARTTGKAVERKPEVVPQTVMPAESDKVAMPIATVRDPLKRLPKLRLPKLELFSRFIATVWDQMKLFPRLQLISPLELFSRLRLLPRLKLVPYQWLIVGLLGLVIILLFFFRDGHEEKSVSVTPSPSQTQPPQKIFIRPLTTTAPTIISEQQSEKEAAGPSEPNAGAVSSPVPPLKVEELQREESSPK